MGNTGCCVSGRDAEKIAKADAGAIHDYQLSKARCHSVSDAVSRAKDCSVLANVSARYHRSPIKLEDDYAVDRSRVLGEGGFAAVCLASDRAGSLSRYAIKSMTKVDLSPYQMEELEAEIEIFLAMDHPHVVRLVDVYNEPGVIHFVMEAMVGGELLKRIETSSQRRLDEEVAAHATWHMLLAINYLHSQGIAHRDLKLENFLYEEEGYEHLKLADFGFGKRIGIGERAHEGVGTLYYLAPEVLEGDYDEKCDMWSFGVIIYVLLCGIFPFKGRDEDDTLQLIHAGEYSMDGEVWSNISDDAKDLVRKLLLLDPTQRISATDALHHAWIQRAVLAGRERLHTDVAKALVAFADASRFTRACLLVMAIVLPSEERDKVLRQFIGMDTDSSGQIGVDEVRAALEGRCDKETADRVFAALDASRGGEVTYSAFLAGTIAAGNGLTCETLEQTFRRLDRDRSGFITEVDFEDILGSVFDSVDVANLFMEAGIDVDKDGRISLEEFLEFFKGGVAETSSRN